MPAQRRNVLMVAPFLPYPADFGGAQRVFHLLRGLAKLHHVHLLVPFDGLDHAHVTALGNVCDITVVPTQRTARQSAGAGKRIEQLRSLSGVDSFLERSLDVPRLQAVFERIFLTQPVDIVQYEFAHTALLLSPRPVATIVDAHNIEYELLRRVAHTSTGSTQQLFNLLEWRKVRRLERRVWNAATLVLATSERDAAVVAASTDRPVLVVPNGVDASDAIGANSIRSSRTVVFVGAMRHHPNADGARWYVEQIHPLVQRVFPDVQVKIVGADPQADVLALASGSVEVTGYVDDVEPFLCKAAVAVVPLRSGSGTRLKILEALAAQLPVVSTTLGAEGIDVRDNVDLFLRDSPQPFADAVIAVLHNTTPPSYSSANGQRLVHQHYDWNSAVIPQLLSAHDRAVELFAQTQNVAHTGGKHV